MANLKCPKCDSERIRLGYRPTHFLYKLIFRYNLLCNTCNLEFMGFAFPGSIPRKLKRNRKLNENSVRKPEFEVSDGETKTTLEATRTSSNEELKAENDFDSNLNYQKKKTVRVRKRVKVRLHRY